MLAILFRPQYMHIKLSDHLHWCTSQRNKNNCSRFPLYWHGLTQCGRVTHICVSNLTIIGSDNGLSPGRRQAIISNNDGILLIWTLGINFREILSEIHTFSFKKMHLKMLSTKWRQLSLGLNELNGNRPLMINCIHCFLGCNYSSMPWLQQQFIQNTVEVRTWMSNYVP